MFARMSLFSASAVLLLISPALADSIPIPNGNFTDPAVADVSPYAVAGLSDWQTSPPPDWWAGTGATTDQWYEQVGAFYNVPSPHIDNAGNQVGFMFSTPGLELSQTLSNTFQVGTSYQLSADIQGGGYGMAIGCPMQIGLYYLDPSSGTQVLVGTTTVLNSNSGAITDLPEWQLNIPAVAASDPWAGQNIGIALIQPDTASGGYWDMDNVQLTATSVPEPGTIALLVVGSGMLVLRRRWLLRKKTSAAAD